MFGRRRHQAAIPPQWSVEHIEQATETLLCRVRTDKAVQAIRSSHQTLMWITVPFLQTRAAGLPTTEEMTSLDDVEQHLERLVADHGMLVVTVTGADVREYLVYSEKADWVDELRAGLHDAIAPHSADVMVQHDPGWAGYRKYGG